MGEILNAIIPVSIVLGAMLVLYLMITIFFCITGDRDSSCFGVFQTGLLGGKRKRYRG
jgi:hypothetical protein